jgi:hypothetical protein
MRRSSRSSRHAVQSWRPRCGEIETRRSRSYVAVIAPRDEPTSNRLAAAGTLRLVTRSDDGYVQSRLRDNFSVYRALTA